MKEQNEKMQFWESSEEAKLFKNDKRIHFWRFVEKKPKVDQNYLDIPTSGQNSSYVIRCSIFHHLGISLSPQLALASDGNSYYFCPTGVSGTRNDYAKVDKEGNSPWILKKTPINYEKKKRRVRKIK